MAFLYQIQADGAPAECWVLGDQPLVVGRSEAADAYVEDEALSRGHFMIMRDAEDFFLVDMDSRNGTWVNGRQVSTHKLRPGELISAGKSLFCFSDAISAEAGPSVAALLAASNASRKLSHAA
jgi:two-component system, NtrC family, sensor kinase